MAHKKNKKHKKIHKQEVEYFNDFILEDNKKDTQFIFEALCIPILALIIVLLVLFWSVCDVVSILKGAL